MTPAIELRDVSKAFVLRRNRVADLKGRVVGWIQPRHRERYETFWALRGIDLTVQPGEFLGVIGPNGSGKSTLLRVIAGILKPSTGEVRVEGRVAPILGLGVGFHPELTGRENIYVNTSLFGLGTRETDAIIGDIIEFAELAPFVDVPVKNYSSGMSVRLGFSVVAHLDPQVVLIDEVLAVGDERFQAKCIERMAEMRRRARTIVWVTHALDRVPVFCDRACLLVGGRLVESGDPEVVVDRYRGLVAVSAVSAEHG